MAESIIQIFLSVLFMLLLTMMFSEQDKKIELLREEIKCVYGRVKDKHPDLPFNPSYHKQFDFKDVSFDDDLEGRKISITKHEQAYVKIDSKKGTITNKVDK